MAVRNIDKGYITTGVEDIDPSNLFNTTLQITGAFTASVPCTFNKLNNIVILTLSAFGGVVTTGGTMSAELPAGYYPVGSSTHIVVYQAYDQSGLSVGTYPGYIQITGQYLDFYLIKGEFVPGTLNQGIQTATTLIYFTS